MFTDNPTIPAQLEVLLDVVHTMRQRKATTESLRQMIQPKGLPDLSVNSRQLALHLSAAIELELIKADEDGNFRLTYPVRGTHNAKTAIVNAFDSIALGDALVEKWAGRVYAYLIARDDDTIRGTTDIDGFSNQFMLDLPPGVDKGNPMNKDKYRALMRWYLYVGLGWMDPAKAFVPDPTGRLRRALPSIWADDSKLNADEFMARLGKACPELDGGSLFGEVTSGLHSASARRCTQALATALRRLHDDHLLTLHCPADSKGWSVEKAGSSVVTGEASNRFDFVENVWRAAA